MEIRIINISSFPQKFVTTEMANEILQTNGMGTKSTVLNVTPIPKARWQNGKLRVVDRTSALHIILYDEDDPFKEQKIEIIAGSRPHMRSITHVFNTTQPEVTDGRTYVQCMSDQASSQMGKLTNLQRVSDALKRSTLATSGISYTQMVHPSMPGQAGIYTFCKTHGVAFMPATQMLWTDDSLWSKKPMLPITLTTKHGTQINEFGDVETDRDVLRTGGFTKIYSDIGPRPLSEIATAADVEPHELVMRSIANWVRTKIIETFKIIGVMILSIIRMFAQERPGKQRDSDVG